MDEEDIQDEFRGVGARGNSALRAKDEYQTFKALPSTSSAAGTPLL
jgi:hypothetical protein